MNNQKAIILTKNSEFYVYTKHINIYHHFIKEVKSYRLIHLNYILISDIIANRLTKLLLISKFTYFINFMILISQ